MTRSDMPSAGWTVNTEESSEWDSGLTEPYSVHICGPDVATLKMFPEFSDLEHVDRVLSGGSGSVAEVVFAGTSEELAEVYESVTRKLGECLADPQEMVDPPLTDDGFDVTASPLPSFGLGLGDFRLRQQIAELNCDHRMALVLMDSRLAIVELSDHDDQFADADFETLVEKAVRQTDA